VRESSSSGLFTLDEFLKVLRGHWVILDKDLAVLDGVTTGNLNKAVNRNLERFPDDFMLRLTEAEFNDLRFHFGRSRWGGTRTLPRAFTEQGVAMLSSVLRSPRAALVDIEIMRAFVRLREMIAANRDLARRLDELEKRYDAQLKGVFDAIRQLMAPPEKTRRSPDVPRNASRCPCRIPLSPRWLSGRGRRSGVPSAAAAAHRRAVRCGIG
jgi:hypothetical protein